MVDSKATPTAVKAPPERAQWNNQVEFLMTMVSYAVGIGNIWRFPYMCFRNGGGAFLIPYFIMLVLLAMPMYYMETSLGQYTGLGPTKAWRISPLFRGLGWASVSISFIIGVYYSVLVAYMLYYLVISMRATVPWINCAAGKDSWATSMCRDNSDNKTSFNESDCINGTAHRPRTASEDYYYRYVSRQSMGIDEPGTIPWHLAVALVVNWLIVGAVLSKGVQSIGKVVYVTAIFPYIMLTILLINNCLKDGARDGIVYYLDPDWSKLTNISAWADAGSQVFFSLAVAYGGLVSMSSYSNFRANITRTTFFVCLINSGTSFYAGFAIFSAMGAMAFQKGVDVADVATTGPELAFVTYPQALAGMPLATLWSILFFCMMCLLGLGSAFSNVENVVTSCMDEFPFLRKTKKRALMFRICILVVYILLALPMITQGGAYLLTLVDDSVGGFPLLFVGMCEAIAISWIYGYKKFSKNIEEMRGSEPHIYWKVMWVTVTPVLLIILVVLKIITIIGKPQIYSGFAFSKECPYDYPIWAKAMGRIITLYPVAIVLIGFVYQWTKGYRKTGSLYHGIIQAAKPSKGFKSQLARDMQDPATYDPPTELKEPSPHGHDMVHAWSVLTTKNMIPRTELDQMDNGTMDNSVEKKKNDGPVDFF